jgi:hypothetical protein
MGWASIKGVPNGVPNSDWLDHRDFAVALWSPSAMSQHNLRPVEDGQEGARDESRHPAAAG